MEAPSTRVLTFWLSKWESKPGFCFRNPAVFIFMVCTADFSFSQFYSPILSIPITKNLLFREYVFELWIEKERILQNMQMAESISAFLHLVFTFGLKYPKVRKIMVLCGDFSKPFFKFL